MQKLCPKRITCSDLRILRMLNTVVPYVVLILQSIWIRVTEKLTKISVQQQTLTKTQSNVNWKKAMILKRALLTVLFFFVFGLVSSSKLSAQNLSRKTVVSYLESGGQKRRQAVWYIYQKRYDDL